MQVLGLCRFSYPAIGGFQTAHASVEERRQFLYQPDRLEERFRLFESIALPGLRQQTDEDFRLLIVVGECLPKPAFERLHDLTADLKQVRIAIKPPGRHRKVMQEVLNAARLSLDHPCLQFRLDDDDAVAVDFVERLRGTVGDCTGLFQKRTIVAIDFNCGYLARADAKGIAAIRVHRPLMTAGLGMFIQGGIRKSIMNFTHNRINRAMPVITRPEDPMWVRGLNRFNDSPRTRNLDVNLSPLSPQQEDEFLARFAINVSHVRQVHSAL
ncbi:putative rhamnosyl transferase [Ruegeria sp. 6PALISEP08]|uniref:putative rhamnosyl transferase n=1 Tax=Ruegeria sp. 6PALISEP08 TaxID=1225660 RepID=UPI00067F5503|nr:putative rhamnosyl transferase [Ruegeria sp. 6PALISEP08]